MESSSVIVLDSDSDDGVMAESRSNSIGGKRKATPSPHSATIHTGPQLNGTSSGNSVVTASGSAQDQPPQRKRIKPITIATNLSDKRWTEGGTPPHNNNNQPIVGNENFAPITYSEDWEQEIKQYQQKLAGAGGDNGERCLSVQTATATVTTATSCRSSTTTNDDMEPNGNIRDATDSVDKSGSATEARDKRVSRKTPSKPLDKNPIGKEFQDLLDACRKADGSEDMETLIKGKLIRYYEIVHPDYVNSKSFKQAVVQVTAGIRAQPNLVFFRLREIVEELSARRKSRSVAQPVEEQDNPVPAQDRNSTGNAKKDQQIALLNHTLNRLVKRIHQLEEAEVDLNQEMKSTYLMTERYKKRAVEVYEKLCDITGENKNAQRMVRKPIQFHGTQYTEFNRMLSHYINKTNNMPDFFDVFKCLQHCNVKHDYGLRSERMNRTAYDAFSKVVRQLQKRRKTDLYETALYHARGEKDPATVDPKLREKLEENGKHYSKVNSIIDKYAEKELILREGNNAKTEKTNTPAEHNNETMPSSSKPSATATSSGTTFPNGRRNANVLELSDNDDDDDDDDDEDDEDDEDDDEYDEDEDDAESTTKENVQPYLFEDDVVISDDEELILIDS
ncbi:daxx-like protein [Anopheles marshallii]|uniref:daxx-like protein n=1 Tax=Anopheles marshallii TaxID=1521116 RepID=UPI00237B7B3E|nr:daxx-like protein [Anopheles marshallii]